MEGLDDENTGGVSWSLWIQLLLDLTSKSSRLLDLTSRSSRLLDLSSRSSRSPTEEGADAKEEELPLREESEGFEDSTTSSPVLSFSCRG